MLGWFSGTFGLTVTLRNLPIGCDIEAPAYHKPDYITEEFLFYSFTFLNSLHNETLNAYSSSSDEFDQLDYFIGSS